MANVLPPAQQKQIVRMYLARLLLALACALLFLASIFQVALVPSYLALAFASPPIPHIPQGGTAAGDPLAVVRAQTLLNTIAPVVNASSSPSMIAAAALSDMPAGVTIQHVSVSSGTDASAATAMIVGAATRENVEAYRSALTKDPLFSSVTVPVSALVGSDAGHFTITLGIAGDTH